MSKSQVKKYASEVKNRSNQAYHDTVNFYNKNNGKYNPKPYYSSGKSNPAFWAKKNSEKSNNHSSDVPKYNSKKMKKKFDVIIKSNQKLKTNDQVDISENGPILKPKFNGQTEL